jgi:hypothetical protein
MPHKKKNVVAAALEPKEYYATNLPKPWTKKMAGRIGLEFGYL